MKIEPITKHLIVSLLAAGGCALGRLAGGGPGGEVGGQARVPLEEAGGWVLHPHQPLALGLNAVRNTQ